MTTQIKFGTSGWRAVMAEEFTFANVQRAVGGIARYVAGQKSQGARVIVGRDPRFLGETFCSMAAEILEAQGITPVLLRNPLPLRLLPRPLFRPRRTASLTSGLSIRQHVPERDGVLAGLLCCEMVAKRGRSLGEQLKELCNQVGSYYAQRENFRLTPGVKEKFTGKLESDPHEFSGRKVAEVVRTDGLKLVFEDGSWVCYRLSGTEPVVRVYSQARSKPGLEQLSEAAKQWIFE